MWYISSVVPRLASSMAESAKCMCVTWLLIPIAKITPDLKTSTSLTLSRIHVASLPQRQECCPDQPLAQRAQLASKLPNPSKACGITYWCAMVLHSEEETWYLFWLPDLRCLAGFCFNVNSDYLKISSLMSIFQTSILEKMCKATDNL